ncbi:ATP-dependent endonuclease [Leptospira biflexa serovar Patoc strain 'Patoc 1 (Ames)']|uniref:Putative nucleoside triphosphate hydrolase n=1 Tax=Leptospira biflexa serovar Patoc (strain Patoc 1 / ATCC 23582 / Paris) TaxID=456481 RepID=B0ST29_LEPBP|nr:AAA family ATPase [Leptospira biflexa]ABZ94607.1 ATP-dependent endonuclease [Leptospira biflexa serovar Patoc strain 'Patoc 1 (Ames)']ABZ98269.1 Putative nucleoside triphosphate hydrolase [Leptospira biflexa serovar Patoc strain 'Patoc 1 (Paris)']
MIKIEHIEILNFRSIVSESIKFGCKEYNVIVGANNSGKSNILRALELFFNGTIDRKKYSFELDFPKATSILAKQTTQISIEFSYDPNKEKKIDLALTDIEKNTKQKRLSNNRLLLRLRLNKSGEPQWNFIGRAGNLNIKQELIDKIVDVVLNSVRFKYIPIGRDILHTIQREISEELVRTIFSGWSGSSVKYRQKINTSLSNLIDDLKPQLSASSQSITNSLQQVFSEIKELELKLPFDSVESMLTFLIPDLTDHYKTSLDSKGAGIQTSSLLFFLKYLADNHPQRHNAVTTFIWAIEEPESFLHPLKQRGVSQILKEFSREVQTFISTHSGNFVNQEQETQLLVVEKDSSAPYSTIIKSNKYDDARESLGVSLIDSMFLKKTNIILEGPSDEILFQGSLLKLHEGKKINLNPEDVKFFTGNNCNSACLLFEAYYPLTKTGEVRNILIIDGDDAGKKA